MKHRDPMFRRYKMLALKILEELVLNSCCFVRVS